MEIKGVEIRVEKGDLTGQKVTAIVNAANNRLLMGGGVAGVIRKKGGIEIEKEAVSKGPIAIGEAVVTGAGKLPCRYVIHAATMGMDFETDEDKIRQSTRNSLLRAEEHKMESVAFPALGCGVGGFPAGQAARIMSEEVVSHLMSRPSALKEIKFILFSEPIFQTFKEVVEGHLGYTQRKLGRYPIPTVDIIIEVGDEGIILIKRKNPPFGWAIPGGFVDWGESLEDAAVREAKEETNLEIKNLRQFHTYSAPGRDPRFHTISTVFIAKGEGKPQAKDDAVEIEVFTRDTLPPEIAFDHRGILTDYFSRRAWGESNAQHSA